jgi:hypothetical protein
MQTYFMGVIFTDHAIKRLYERGITQSDAWYTFRHPDKQLRGTTSGSYKYYKDYGKQRIEVVVKQNEKGEWVVLSCWSKLMGTGKPIFPQKENFFWSLTKKVLRKFWKAIRKNS